MGELPIITLERLVLRPFTLDDAKLIQKYAGDKEIAKMTLNIPHPYEDGMAEEWINTHFDDYNNGKSLTLAITNKKEKYLIGAIGLRLNKKYEHAELGYWIGKKYWNNGYCTEAAKGIIKYGFNEMNLNRIYASHLKKNPASGRVMEKVGMKYEGLFREHVKKWGDFQDLVYNGIIKKDHID
ncbi:MAG: GNAT family N-acetyltransferase [Bacteroidota bacterium]